MKKVVKIFALLLLVLVISAAGYLSRKNHKIFHATNSAVADIKRSSATENTILRLYEKASFVENKNRYNRYSFFIDMKVASGKKRFFIYDLETDSIITSALVTHGSGSARGTGALTFSNVPHSNSTSLGKYRVGKPYTGRFGLAYKLYGLDGTNSKAFERFVVLHAHSCVPDEEIDPFPLCESWGCPTVSPAFLLTLKKYIDKADKPILLWIYF